MVNAIALHRPDVVLTDSACPPAIGWRATFWRALRLRSCAGVGSTELQVRSDPDRDSLAAGTLLNFQDYGWPYGVAELAAELLPGDEVAIVKPLTRELASTARAAVSPLSLATATLSGNVLATKTGPIVQAFTPRFVGSAAAGVVDAEVLLEDLPDFTGDCHDPPYWLRVTVDLGEVSIFLLLGQTQAEVLLPEATSRFVILLEQLPLLDPNQPTGGLAQILPSITFGGDIALSPITTAALAQILPGVVFGGDATTVPITAADLTQSLPIGGFSGNATVTSTGDMVTGLPGTVLGGGVTPISTGSLTQPLPVAAFSGDATAPPLGINSLAQPLPVTGFGGNATIASTGDLAQPLGSALFGGDGTSITTGGLVVGLPVTSFAGSGDAPVETSGGLAQPLTVSVFGGDITLASTGGLVIGLPITSFAGSSDAPNTTTGDLAQPLPISGLGGNITVLCTASLAQPLPVQAFGGNATALLGGSLAQPLPVSTFGGSGNLSTAGDLSQPLPVSRFSGDATTQTIITPILVPVAM